MRYEVPKEYASKILTSQDLSDFYAYVERLGEEPDYIWPAEDAERIDELMDGINYVPGEYDNNNIDRITDKKQIYVGE